MPIPNQDLIVCKKCGQKGPADPRRRLLCAPCTRRLHVEYTAKHRRKLQAAPKLVECKGCGLSFSTKKSGRVWRCADCTRQYLKDRLSTRKGEGAASSKRYRERLGDEYRTRCKKRRDDLIASLSPEELVEYRKAEAKKMADARKVALAKVFDGYGGAICPCCGETEPLFLCVDHKDNNGNVLRKTGAHPVRGLPFYHWLIKNKFPDSFQILCVNCNTGKHRNGGVCPHQSGKV